MEEKSFVLKKHTSKYYEHNDGLNPKTSSFAKAITTAKGRKTISRTATWKKSESACFSQGFVSATVVKHNGQFYIFPLQDYKEDRLQPLRSSKVKMKR